MSSAPAAGKKSKPKGASKPKKKRKTVADPIKALWRKGGPLNGFKSMPKLISKVGKDGNSFEVKGFVRDDNKLEESMTLVLIHALDWPRSPSNDWKVDAYYPNYSFFAELHETQHVDQADFRMKMGTKWADQKLADKRKLLHLVKQGYHGIIVLGFVGPFFDPEHASMPKWIKLGASETQKRTMLALRVVAQARVESYKQGNYEGRVYVFTSAIATANQELQMVKSGELEKASATTLLKYNCFDPMDIGGRYLELPEVNEAARIAAQSFSAEQKAKLLAEAEAMLAKVTVYLAKKQPQADPAPVTSSTSDSEDEPDNDDDEDGSDTEVDEVKPVPMNTTTTPSPAAPPAAPIQGQLVYVTDSGRILHVKTLEQLGRLSLKGDEEDPNDRPPFPEAPTQLKKPPAGAATNVVVMHK